MNAINRKAFSTSMDEELIKELKIYCAKKGLKQNQVLEELIKELLEKEGVGERDGNTDQ